MSEIREAPRELLALAVAMREDWDSERTWNALLAAHAAGWTFPRALREVTRLLLIEDSSPADLRVAAGETRSAAPGSLPDDLRAQVLAASEAATEAMRQQRNAADFGTGSAA